VTVDTGAAETGMLPLNSRTASIVVDTIVTFFGAAGIFS